MFTIISAFLSGSHFLLLCFFCDTKLSKAVFLHAFFFSRRSERKKLSEKDECREEEEGGGRSLRRFNREKNRMYLVTLKRKITGYVAMGYWAS